MNPENVTHRNAEFDLRKWLARESVNDVIVPRENFPDLSEHPFFKRKLEAAMELYATCPPPERKIDR